MHPFFKAIPGITWIATLVYWFWNAKKTKVVAKQEGNLKQFLFYWLPILVAAVLLGPGKWFGHSLLREQFLPHSNLVGTTGGGLCLSGLAIAGRARYLLGKNWSLAVQLKQKHELIVSGPYRYVRHPIYSGLLLMFSGTTLIVGDWRGILAVIIVFFSFWYKLKMEESWLGNYFGNVYLQYKASTKALIPFIL